MSNNQYALGRTLQLCGLMIVPFAIASELSGAMGLGMSMLVSGVGLVVFYAGYLTQEAR